MTKYARREIVTVRDSITRPGNTTAYTAGDVIAEVTTNDHFSFDLARPLEHSGSILAATIYSSQNAATKLDGELYLFIDDIAEVGDNNAFAPTDSESLTCFGVIDFATATWKTLNAGAAAAGNAMCQITDINLPFRIGQETCAGVLVARNAYVPVASEVFTIDLHVQRD